MSKISSTYLDIIGSALSVCAVVTSIGALRDIMQKNHWANNEPLLYLDPSIRKNYTIENMVDGKEVLIYVTKKELETMDEQGKADFLERFTFNDETLAKSLFDCICNKRSFYLSGIPNIGDGKFCIYNVTEYFETLNMLKCAEKIRTFTKQSIISFLIFGCAFMSFKIGRTLK